MKVLLKIGGTLLDEAATRARLAREITAAAHEHEILVVHGGGRQMTAYLNDLGIKSSFVNGLRVTNDQVLDAVLKIFAGSVNKQLVSAFRAAGANAVGLSGLDGGVLDAELLDPALGHVGKPVKSNMQLLDLLIGNGYQPVIACVAGDSSGAIYNVNGDQMASTCAVAFQAAKLIFLTDVDGVRDELQNVIAVLPAGEARAMIASGFAKGGMQAKLESAIAALEAGVGEVRIVPGEVEGVVTQAMAGASIGTQVTYP